MTQQVVNLLVSFEALVEAITKLNLKEKYQLWALLDKQMAQVETKTVGESSTIETEIQETRIAYQTPAIEHSTQLKHKITSLLDILPEAKLPTLFDFRHFLVEQDLQVAWLNAQSQSAAYQEWIGSDNDIYDEVFADAHPAQ